MKAPFAAAIAAAALSGAAARADDVSQALADLAAPLASPTLSLNLADELARVTQPADQPKPEERPRSQAYGKAGSRWWTVGTGVANDFGDNTDFNIHGAWSQFLTDDFEFAIEGAAWYFHQEGDDTGGLSCSMVFRWHFLHADDYNWSIFGDAGIGILGAFDDVPDGGTSFDFLPRIGGGFTKALNDSIDGESRGPRLMVGARYHHISNGRIQGDTRNPSRDGLMLYVAITFPF
jgi:hypothetical protein